MEVLLFAGAVAASGYFVRMIDRRNELALAIKKRQVADEGSFKLAFEDSGPLESETVYADDRYAHNALKVARRAEERMSRIVRERSLYTDSQDLPQQPQHWNLANRSVVERFSSDLPETNMNAWNRKRESEPLFGPVPTYGQDAVGDLQKMQNRAKDTLSGRMDGVPLKGTAQPDMPISDVAMRLSGALTPKTGDELYVKYKQTDIEDTRSKNPDRIIEMPPVLAELRKPRNPLASKYNHHTGWMENTVMTQNLPNRETEFVSSQIAKQGRARRRYDEEAVWVSPNAAQDAGLALRPIKPKRKYPQGHLREEFAPDSAEFDPLRPRNNRPSIDSLNIGPVEMTRFDARDPLQKTAQAPDPTKKEEVLVYNEFLNRHINVDANVDDHMMHRPEPPRHTAKDLISHTPRVPLADNGTRLVGQFPLLQRMDMPKVGRRETTIFSHDPNSGLIGPKSNNLWSVNDGRGHTPRQAPRLNLREMISSYDAPRQGMMDRSDLDAGGREGGRQHERNAKIYDNANFNRPPATHGAHSEVPNRHSGDNENVRQMVAWDGHARGRPFSNIPAPPPRQTRTEFVMEGRDQKARFQSVLESGVSWPGGA